MGKRLSISILLWWCLFGWGQAAAQSTPVIDTGSLNNLQVSHNKFVNNIFQQAVNSIKKTPGPGASYLNGKSEDPYLPYQGKIIRHINIETINFDRSFKDTSLRDNTLGSRVGRRLHMTTSNFVIRNNLFIKENTPLNAFKVADNERFIRSLEYIHDARFIVDTVEGATDSVDVTVITKDLFSIAGGMEADGLNRISANVYDANLAGMGQRLELTGLYAKTRENHFGFGGYYRKNNMFHTFIDATIGYSTVNISPLTNSEQTTEYLTLSRPLISPYSRVAGALTISHNEAYNSYNLPDSQIFKYRYNLFDAWAGYNLGIKLLTATNNTIRDRRFLSFRVFDRQFVRPPYQIEGRYNPIYNSAQAALAQITFFRQDYYRSQYIYGFGFTEDLPYGYNIAITTGWHRQLDLQRPYGGINATHFIATKKGDFIKLYLRAGGYLHEGSVQDGGFLVGATIHGRLFNIDETKVRSYINASYTHLYNRTTTEPLRINNDFGPRGFLSDSAFGSQRLTIQLETVFYLPYKLWGFQFAPFPYLDFTGVTPQDAPFSKSNLYTSLGGGIRARNENLVFETIEARAYFFPVAPNNMKGFKVVVNANLRYRYANNYITAPELLKLN